MKKAKDIMNYDLTCVKEETPLKETLKLLAEHSLSGVPVVNNKNEVVGFISEKDIIISAFPERLKLENTEIISLKQLVPHIMKLSRAGVARVKDHMSETLYSVTEETPLADIIGLILEKNLKRIPVLGKNKRLVGMIERSKVFKICRKEVNDK